MIIDIHCPHCRALLHYAYDPTQEVPPDLDDRSTEELEARADAAAAERYDSFVDWAIDDAAMNHPCPPQRD